MKAFRIIGSLTLAFLVLLSSSSFIVGIHLCGGEVQHIALFKKAEKCEREMKMPPCHRHMAACCEDDQIYHEGQGFKHTTTSLDLSAPFFTEIVVTPVLISTIIDPLAEVSTGYRNYDPPLRTPDLNVSLQVFLI